MTKIRQWGTVGQRKIKKQNTTQHNMFTAIVMIAILCRHAYVTHAAILKVRSVLAGASISPTAMTQPSSPFPSLSLLLLLLPFLTGIRGYHPGEMPVS